MLNEIYIRNYLFVPEQRLKFGPGMTVLSGETGAGKSILVGSISLIFGETPFPPEAYDPTQPIWQQGEKRLGIVIEDDVWIGSGVRVMDGVRIGRGSVIGAGTVVTKSIPENSVAVGVPARIVGRRGEKRCPPLPEPAP